jgi:hypothetical protein
MIHSTGPVANPLLTSFSIESSYQFPWLPNYELYIGVFVKVILEATGRTLTWPTLKPAEGRVEYRKLLF